MQVQTKFSPISAQDVHNMPYDAKASVTEQVHTSIKSSLHHLRPFEEADSEQDVYIDTLIIHSPLPTLEKTIEAWLALETYVPHRIRNLGLSNCNLSVLQELCNSSQIKVKPAVVQNRFYEDTFFDGPIRIFCRQNQIIYQSFWTLTANPGLVQSAPVQLLAARTKVSPAAALYTLVMGLGNVSVLNGTQNETRMKEDLAAPLKVEKFTQEQPAEWKRLLTEFQVLIGDAQS